VAFVLSAQTVERAVLKLTAAERAAASGKLPKADPKDAAAAADLLLARLTAAVEEAECKVCGFTFRAHEKEEAAKEAACKERGFDSCTAEIEASLSGRLLHYAGEGKLGKLQLALKEGAEADVVHPVSKSTPLATAVQVKGPWLGPNAIGGPEIVAALLKAGAKADTVVVEANKAGTALAFATVMGSTEICAALTVMGSTEIFAALIGAGAKLDAQDAVGNTALPLVAASGRADTAALLVDAGAKTDIKNVCVDHYEQLDAIVARAAQPPHAAEAWSVVLMVDCGYHRDGVDAESALAQELAAKALAATNVELFGVYTHGGHSYDAGSVAAVQRRGRGGARCDGGAGGRIQRKLKTSALRSDGSTPTASNSPPSGLAGINELHPGNFMLYDTMQHACGSCGSLDDGRGSSPESLGITKPQTRRWCI